MSTADDQLDRIVEALQQVNVTLEGLRVSLSSLIQVSEDHEQRLRTIEKWQNNLTPVLAAITFMLGIVFSVALERFL